MIHNHKNKGKEEKSKGQKLFCPFPYLYIPIPSAPLSRVSVPHRAKRVSSSYPLGAFIVHGLKNMKKKGKSNR